MFQMNEVMYRIDYFPRWFGGILRLLCAFSPYKIFQQVRIGELVRTQNIGTDMDIVESAPD